MVTSLMVILPLNCEVMMRRGVGVSDAPPSAASNSRRPMVTVIRPSRARCVKGTIPRHERAVLTARHPVRTERVDFKRFIFGRAVGRALINAGIGRMIGFLAASTARIVYPPLTALREHWGISPTV